MSKFTSFARRHLGALIAATATAVVLVGGLLILVAAGGGGSSASAAASTPPTTATTVAPSTPPASRGAGRASARQGVRGRITAINGTTWTVMSARGAPVMVEVTPSTAFGTNKAPLSSSDFAVGDQIVVVGTRNKATVTATRIAKVSAGAATSPTTTIP